MIYGFWTRRNLFSAYQNDENDILDSLLRSKSIVVYMCKEPSTRIIQLASGFLLLIYLIFASAPQTFAAASRTSYYDFGTYYERQQQILGISLSSLEKLAAPAIPQDILPPPAKGIVPGNPLHPFELLIENVQLTFTRDALKREELRLQIASERLSETTTLIEQKQYDLAADTAASYKNTMKIIAANMETLQKNNVSGINDLIGKVESVASAHSVISQSLAISSPPTATSTWNTITNATEKAMDQAADATGVPSIPEDLSTSIQELKSQGLLTPEQSNKLYSLESRGEVREELNKLAGYGQFPLAEMAKLDQAVAANYPAAYKETVDLLRFLELRTYQTLPRPSADIVKEIEEWKNQKTENVPPSPEIRQYLYIQRGEALAKTIDFTNFTPEQQTEAAKFYPQAVEENPTIQISPTPTLSPTPTTTSPDVSPTPTSPPAPTPTPPSAEPYITEQRGALPGDPAYFFKQFGEQVSLATTFDPARKLELAMRYAEERFREATALSKVQNKQKVYEKTLKRYQETLESVSKDIKDFKGNEEAKRDLAEKLQGEAVRHNVVLEKGLLPVPSEETKVYAEIIKATENAMDRSADALGRPSLPTILANRLQDLKAQGLILSEEVDQISQANSREEARERVRKLVELGTFPAADAKKMDEAQALVSPTDYNQLVEVRKIEELQQLRAVQAEFAQIATLRQTNTTYEDRIKYLQDDIDPSVIAPEDLAGREDLLKTYKNLVANADKRSINRGQFGSEVIPGFIPSATPSPQDAVLTTCPIGAVFKQFEGCVWEDTGKKINDYDQYRCGGGREYWSFLAKKCVPSDDSPGIKEDASPLCPVGYGWSWESQNCQTSAGGRVILPSPKPEPTPASDQEREERSKSCPAGSSYQVPLGCVWDENGKPIYDQAQYQCGGGQYFSFATLTCVSNPKTGEAFGDDAHPACKDTDTAWSWSEGACVALPESVVPAIGGTALSAPKPIFVAPDSPLYFLKRAVERVQSAVAFTEQAKQEVRLAHAKERFAEGYYLLERKDEEGFQKTLAEYTGQMQDVYNDMPKIAKLNDSSQKILGEKLNDLAVEQNLLLQKATIIASPDTATPISAAVSVTIQGVDRAADLQGEPAIPEDIKTKIEALPKDMIPDDEKKKLLDVENRIEARIKLGALASSGLLSQKDTAFLDTEMKKETSDQTIKLDELRKLSEITSLQDQKEENEQKVEKAEDITKKLDEFQKNFEPGKDVPSDIRPYVRLTRIEEVAQTIRPDIVNLGDFGNRRDIQLAVATLKEEFKPTKESMRKVEEFRRTNPGRPLPFELARIEALSFGLGVRETATACFLPSPPFTPNTPCPSPGAAIPVTSYYTSFSGTGFGGFGQAGTSVIGTGAPGVPSTDKDGKPFVYGQGPKAASFGTCPDGYHWMYDSGGWCMSNSGNYSSSSVNYGGNYNTNYTGSPGYTPYSSYYSAPGASPTTSGYPVGDVSPNDGCPYGYDSDNRGNCIPNSYPASSSSYTPPSYYGSSPTYYTTNPPAGTVPGTGPQPTATGQCPSGYHWMSDSGGWCMADAGTYVPSGATAPYSSGATGYCSAPSTGCGSNSYWDYGSCSCRSSSTYSGGSGPGSSNYCQGVSCGGGSYLDYSTCSCKYSSSGGSSSSTSGSSCSPPAGGCGSGWYDVSSCSCKAASSQGCYNVSASSCGSGFYWDSAACTCRSTTTSSTPPTTSSSGGGTTSGSCPSGYHWMSDNGGWCMADGSTSTPTNASTSTSGESSSGSTGGTPAPTSAPSTESQPAPTSSAPAPESQPPPTSAPSTESQPAPIISP